MKEEKRTTEEALLGVMREVTSVGKDSTNANQGFRFRGIDDVLNKVGPALRKHGVIVQPAILEKTHSFRDGRNGKLNHWTVEVSYWFQVPGGAAVDVIAAGEAMDAGDKGLAKAMSVAYRTALIQMLALPTGEPDPDSETYELDRPAPSITYTTDGPGSVTIPCSEPTVGAPTVSELRRQIISELQANRSPAWTLEEIAADFQSRTKENIREAGVEALKSYLEMVRK